MVAGSLGNNVKKRKRSETPPEEIRSNDEARHVEQEERAAKRADHDMDYEARSSTKSLSDQDSICTPTSKFF
jgi:hypothetical protein